ncbi:MAG: LPS export ABC transporter permease LptF [Desulfuromonas sp.]|mgnify:CR=1 FL=1|nr:MAG: LPS export ABC transporter permease LptF [Desulfuromonas sp.]
MAVSRIHRYIFREISTPTILSLLIFTFVLFMGRIPKVTELVVSKGVAAGVVFQLFLYLMPTFLSITLPLSFLLGMLLAFGRFSADNEFIALKASGVGLYNLIKPVLLMGVFFTLLTGLITVFIGPASKTGFRQQLFQIASGHAAIDIKPGVFSDEFDGIVFYAGGVDEQRGTMQDIFISDERAGSTPATITAKTGRFFPDAANSRLTLRLSDGSIHRLPVKDNQASYQTIRFTSYDINIDLGAMLNDRKRHRSTSELSWSELNTAIAASDDKERILRLQAEKHERIVIAFAPLTLVLVGVPLGLQSQRSGKGSGFSLALLVFLAYYILLSIAGTIAEEGLFPSAIILWLPNICFLAGGAYFLHRTAIERPFKIFTLPQRLRKLWIRRRAVTKDDE